MYQLDANNFTMIFFRKCPKHVEAIYEKKIIVKLFASSWYLFLTSCLFFSDSVSNFSTFFCFVNHFLFMKMSVF